MSEPIRTDVVVIGAGPAGLFAVFELGLFGFACRVVDALDRPGGQCAALYADKPVYDVPGHPAIAAQHLVEKLLEQGRPFAPAFHFGETVTAVTPRPDGGFTVATMAGGAFEAAVVVIAAGLGPLGPGRPAPDGPCAGFGLALQDGRIPVDPGTSATAVPGLFAIGDVAAYPGKLPLLLCAFHEAALATQAIRRHLDPDRRLPLPYTSSSTALQRKLGVG